MCILCFWKWAFSNCAPKFYVQDQDNYGTERRDKEKLVSVLFKADVGLSMDRIGLRIAAMAHKSVAVIAVGLLTMSGSAAFAAEKVTIGNAQIVVKTVIGEFEANGEEERKLELLDDVYHNEIIETQESAAAEFVFLDNTKLALGPESSLVLDKFVYDPDPDKASFVMTATSGVFRFASGNLPGKAYKINTPTATIGIRGTKFTIVVVPANVHGDRSGPIVNVTVEEGIVDLMGCKGEMVSLDHTGPSTTVSMKADGTCVGPSAPGAQPTRFSRLLNRIAVAKE